MQPGERVLIGEVAYKLNILKHLNSMPDTALEFLHLKRFVDEIIGAGLDETNRKQRIVRG